MLLYILLFVISILFFLILYIRITNKFWYAQPILHSYNILYKLFPIGVINKKPFLIKKYYDPHNIEFDCLASLKNIKQKQFLKFIKHHYFYNNKFINHYSYKNITSYFKNNNMKSYISFYTQPKTLFDFQKNISIKDKEIIGVITTRPLYITCRNVSFPIYYIDYSCLLPYYKKKSEYEFTLIHTHIYKQTLENNNIKSLLFTCLKPLPYTTPFLQYFTYLYDISQILNPIETKFQYKIIVINKQNMNLFTSFIKSNLYLFDCYITPYLSNLFELVYSKTIIIYGIILGTTPLGFYIFKNSPTLYENKVGKSIELFTSIINTTELNNCVSAFPLICLELYQQYNPKYLRINNVAFNHEIIEYIKPITKPIMSKNNYIYLYNYIEKPIKSRKFFGIY